MDESKLDKGPARKRETGVPEWDSCTGVEIEVGRLNQNVWNDRVPRSFKIENNKTALVHNSLGAGSNNFNVERVPIEALRTQLESLRQNAQSELDEAKKNMNLIEQALLQLPGQDKQSE